MQSSSCVRNEEIVVQASLDESIKEAERSLGSEELLNQCLDVVAKNEGLDKDAVPSLKITIVGGALRNQTKGTLSVLESKNYAGYFVKSPPNTLQSTGALVMAAIFNRGVKAAVVYSGKNEAGFECGWLLAFADHSATGGKIYAECGRKDKFKPIDWAKVEKKLDMAGATAKAYDEETRTSLDAAIAGSKGKSAFGAVYRG